MPEFANNVAVIIGINQYGGGIPPLSTPVNDAQELARILKQEHQYRVLQLLLDAQATRSALYDLLDTVLPQAVQPDDRLLFFFAGHGIALDGEDGPAAYVIPQDVTRGDTKNYIPMARVEAALSALPCRHFLGILDCCFAGALRWSSTRDLSTVPEVLHKERYERFIQDPAWQVIASAGSDQKAYDTLPSDADRGHSGAHSPFAAALLDALAGQADRYPPAANGTPAGDGVITATDLYVYVRDCVEPATEGQRQRQTPGLWPLKKHDKGEYIFLTPGHVLNLPPAKPLDASQNPYRGLQAFEEEHRDVFFGRQALIDGTEDTPGLYTSVQNHPVTVVLGASGSGKSSLVKAGLLPHVRQIAGAADQPQWRILPPMRPGGKPFQALQTLLQEQIPGAPGTETTDGHTSASLCARMKAWCHQHPTAKLLLGKPFQALQTLLAQAQILGAPGMEATDGHTSASLCARMAAWCQQHPTAKLLLVIDQLEEVLTLCQDHRERENFCNFLTLALARSPEQLRLVLTLRSDFEPQFQDTALKAWWQSAARFVVRPMTRAELREAIEEPASKRVMYFHSDDPKNPLVDQLITEVADMPGALPLLSFTLSELYLKYLERQQVAQDQGDTIDRAITEADYKALGGVAHSLTQRADAAYTELVQQDSAYECTICNVMLRMVTMSGGDLTRRRVLWSELRYPEPGNERVKGVVQRFTDTGLLSQGSDVEHQPYVEPAHDVLVSGWPRLATWKNQELENLILQRALTPEALQWERGGKNRQVVGLLWDADPRLPLLKQILTGKNSEGNVLHNRNWLNKLETEFVEKSLTRKRNKSRRAIGITAGVCVCLAGLAVFAFIQLQYSVLREKAGTVRNQLSTEPLQSLLLAMQVTGESASRFGHVLSPVEYSLSNAVADAREQVMISSQQGEVFSLAWSPDGQTLVSGGKDGTISLWDRTGKSLGTFQAHERFHRFSTELGASDLLDKKVFPPALQEEFRNHEISLSKPVTVSIAAENPTWWRIQSAIHNDFYITREHDQLAIYGSDMDVTALAFSADGQKMVSGGEDGTVRVWDRRGQWIGLLKHQKRVTSVAFLTGDRGVSASADGAIYLWDLKNGNSGTYQVLSPSSYESFSHIPARVAVSPDRQRIAAVQSDHDDHDDHDNLLLWDGNGKLLRRQQDTNDGRVQGSFCSIAFSADSKSILVGRGRCTNSEGSGSVVGFVVEQWDLDNMEQDNSTNRGDYQFQGHTVEVLSIASASSGRIASSSDNTIRLWKPQDKGELLDDNVPSLITGHTENVNVVIFNPKAEQLASASADGTIRIWDVSDSFDRSDIEYQELTHEGHPVEPEGGNRFWDVKNLTFSADGHLFAFVINSEHSSEPSCNVLLFDSQSHQLKEVFKEHCGPIAFSPDSQTIVGRSTHADAMLELWDLQGTPRQIFRGHEGEVTAVAFSPDGKTILSGSADGTVRLWDLQGTPRQIFRGHEGEVTAVAFSPDGKTILSGSADGTVRLWDLQGTPRQIFRGHEGEVTAVAFSPDGKTILSGSADKNIRLWDVRGRPAGFKVLRAHSKKVNAVAFSPDGQRIVSASTDQTIKFWNLDGSLAAVPFQNPTDSPGSAGVAFALSPNGTMLLTSIAGLKETGSYVRLMKVRRNWQDWLQVACQRLSAHEALVHPANEVAKGAKAACQPSFRIAVFIRELLTRIITFRPHGQRQAGGAQELQTQGGDTLRNDLHNPTPTVLTEALSSPAGIDSPAPPEMVQELPRPQPTPPPEIDSPAPPEMVQELPEPQPTPPAGIDSPAPPEKEPPRPQPRPPLKKSQARADVPARGKSHTPKKPVPEKSQDSPHGWGIRR